MKETQILQKIRLECSRGDVRLWRNNVGGLIDSTGRFVQFGLCVGSSDLIGYKSIVITPDMVGQRVAVFTALEVKAHHNSKLTDAQRRFLQLVRNAGGIGAVVRGIIEAKAALKVTT